MQKAIDNQVNILKAARILGLSEQRMYQLLLRLRIGGAKTVIHENRGNNHEGKTSEEYKQKVKDFARGKYKEFNDRHFQGKLLE